MLASHSSSTCQSARSLARELVRGPPPIRCAGRAGVDPSENGSVHQRRGKLVCVVPDLGSKPSSRPCSRRSMNSCSLRVASALQRRARPPTAAARSISSAASANRPCESADRGLRGGDPELGGWRNSFATRAIAASSAARRSGSPSSQAAQYGDRARRTAALCPEPWPPARRSRPLRRAGARACAARPARPRPRRARRRASRDRRFRARSGAPLHICRSRRSREGSSRSAAARRDSSWTRSEPSSSPSASEARPRAAGRAARPLRRASQRPPAVAGRRACEHARAGRPSGRARRRAGRSTWPPRRRRPGSEPQRARAAARSERGGRGSVGLERRKRHLRTGAPPPRRRAGQPRGRRPAARSRLPSHRSALPADSKK